MQTILKVYWLTLGKFQKTAIAKIIWLYIRNLVRYTNTANY